MNYLIPLLIFLGILLAYLSYKLGRFIENNAWVGKKIEEIVQKRLKASRATIGGQVSEQLAPFLPGFPHLASEARFIGKPIDFIIFKGMDNKEISEVIFVEVKSGKHKRLTPQELNLKKAIEEKRVSWHQYNIQEK